MIYKVLFTGATLNAQWHQRVIIYRWWITGLLPIQVTSDLLGAEMSSFQNWISSQKFGFGKVTPHPWKCENTQHLFNTGCCNCCYCSKIELIETTITVCISNGTNTWKIIIILWIRLCYCCQCCVVSQLVVVYLCWEEGAVDLACSSPQWWWWQPCHRAWPYGPSPLS